MAGKQSSEVKRRTASTRKTTTTRKSSAGKKRNTSVFRVPESPGGAAGKRNEEAWRVGCPHR